MAKTKELTAAEANRRHGQWIEWREEIAEAFPCPECNGEGEHYPGQHYDPCLECYGNGFLIPEEDDQ